MRHLLVGASGTAMYMIGVATLVELAAIDPKVAVAISYTAHAVFTYYFARTWVHGSTEQHSRTVPKFLILCAISLGLNTGIMALAVNGLELWYFWGVVATVAIVPPTNFLLSYYWVFR